jgi:hypothetical protein
MTTRSAARTEFLNDLLVTAIENYGYGWFEVDEYPNVDNAADAYAVIREEDTNTKFRVTLDTMAHGLSVIRHARVGPAVDHEGNPVRCNVDTGYRLYFGGEARTELLLADRTNGDDGGFDVIGALAVLECALFGQVIYA